MRIREDYIASGITVEDESGCAVAKFFYRRGSLSDAAELAALFIATVKEKPERIMSGEYSKRMWDAINTAETVEDLQDALYLVCCRLQELESRISRKDK